MLKKTAFIIFIFFIINIYILYSNDVNGFSDDFKEIINIDKDNNELINLNVEDLTYKKLFYYFVLVSEGLDQYQIYDKWFQNAENKIENKLLEKFNRVDAVNWKEEKQKEFAESLLVFIHETMFKRYYFYASKISDIVNKGEFNCVSSSIIYAILLKKYGLDAVGVETIDHVFIKILFENEKIDVETTNSFGFDPGKKKEILDRFGQVTGFSYVSAKDYKNRNDIDLKKLIFIVYHNLTDYYMKNGDFFKSAKIGYLIYKGRNDEKGKNDFEIGFLNYINNLSKKNNNIEAINTLNSFLDYFEKSKKYFDIRFDFLNNYVYYWNSYNDITGVQNFLLSQNDKYPEIKNDKRFIEIYFEFIYKVATFSNRNENFSYSYQLIKDFTNKFELKDIYKIFNNTLLDEMSLYAKLNNYEKISDRLNTLKNEFPEYLEIIKKNQMSFAISKINYLLSQQEYSYALNEAKKLNVVFSEDQNVKNTLLNCYLNYTVYFYKNKDLKNVIYYSDEGLKNFPNNRTLNGNFRVFLKNFIIDEMNKENFMEARRIVNIALEKFPTDSFFKKTDNELRLKNY